LRLGCLRMLRMLWVQWLLLILSWIVLGLISINSPFQLTHAPG